MSKYACVQPNGIVTYTVTLSDDDHIPQNNNDDSIFIAVKQDIDDSILLNSYYNFTSKEFTALPSKQHEHCIFDYETKNWVLDNNLLSKSIVSERNNLLYESDWTQLPDAPVDQVAWATYRQHLRDITSQSGFPTIIDWGKSPSEE